MHWLEEYYGPGMGAIDASWLDSYSYWRSILQRAGVPANVLNYAIAQSWHESDYGKSNVSKRDNNYSGIQWLNKPYQNATKGVKKPGGGYYAHFKDVPTWANDFVRVLSINGSKGRPIDATTANDYINRLRANNYFTDANYSRGFNRALNNVSATLKWYADTYKPEAGTSIIKYTGNSSSGNPTKKVEVLTPGTEKVKHDIVHAADDKAYKEGKPVSHDYQPPTWWSKLHWYEKGGLIAAGLVSTVVLMKASKS